VTRLFTLHDASLSAHMHAAVHNVNAVLRARRFGSHEGQASFKRRHIDYCNSMVQPSRWRLIGRVERD